MEYLARIALDHQGIQEMLQVQRELNERLKKAKGVNIVHLDNTLRFWRDFLAQEHMSWEEEFAFALFRKLDRGLSERLQDDHEKIKTILAKLETTIKALRSGRPHSSQEFTRWGEEMAETVAEHLAREKTALRELELQGGAEQNLELQPEKDDRLQHLVQVAEELCQEYLQKSSALRPLQEDPVVVEEEEAETEEGDLESIPVDTATVEIPAEAEAGGQ